MRTSIIILIALLFSCSSLLAESDSSKKWGIGFHPIIGYDDEVRLTIGGACVLYFEHEDENQDLDEIDIHSTYNMENQCDFMMDFYKYTRNNNCAIEGQIGFQNYPDDYEENDFDAMHIPFELTALFKINEKWSAGPMYKFKYSDIDFDDQVFAEQLIGSGKVHYSGLGWKISYKNLPKAEIYRRSGNVFEVAGIHYSPYLGSSEEFSKLSMDYRQYFPVKDKSVLAFQITGKTSFSNIPFNYDHDLENKGILRGGQDKHGKHFLATQLEYRFPIFSRIGAAVFVGMGNVDNEYQDLLKRFDYAGGVGPRIILNKKKNITVRFDFAINDQLDKSIYIRIKEAF